MLKKVRKVILVFIIIIFSLAVADLFYRGNDGWQLESWKQFKKKTIEENDLIEDISISGNNPDFTISYKLSREVSSEADLKKIEKIFDETRNLLLTEETFPELLKMHKKRHRGTLAHIHIGFYHSEEDNRDDCYIFSSYSVDDWVPKYSSFKTWYIEHNGITKEYISTEK